MAPDSGYSVPMRSCVAAAVLHADRGAVSYAMGTGTPTPYLKGTNRHR